ncbi:hypothetical protein AVEN_243458-1 [Araneus ventricosus]|uniref:Uncharacterized protein n=1 Tax=Araneus ventricosus TaxID=182803 RepID=A0A4Y2UI21_ARAVE|nr:hypothetical protein AVEN_243458-1 [Araneus ventricosus]
MLTGRWSHVICSFVASALDSVVEDPWHIQADRVDPIDSRLRLHPGILGTRGLQQTHLGALPTMCIHCDLSNTSHSPAATCHRDEEKQST